MACCVQNTPARCVLTCAPVAVYQLTTSGAVVSLLFRFEYELRTLVPDDFDLVVLAPQVSTCLTLGRVRCYTTSCTALVPTVGLRKAMSASDATKPMLNNRVTCHVLLWNKCSIVGL